MVSWWDSQSAWVKGLIVAAAVLAGFLLLGAIVGSPKEEKQAAETNKPTRSGEPKVRGLQISIGRIDMNYPATSQIESGVFNENHRPFSVELTVRNGTPKAAQLAAQFSEEDEPDRWIECVFEGGSLAEQLAPKAEAGETWRGLAVCGPLKPPLDSPPAKFRVTDFFGKPYGGTTVGL